MRRGPIAGRAPAGNREQNSAATGNAQELAAIEDTTAHTERILEELAELRKEVAELRRSGSLG